ncbi:MAG: SdrD B-like domain-containing protein [Methanomassiliicoccales archaeon]
MSEGWYPTQNASGNVTLEVLSGSSEEVWFGNSRSAEILGYKFFDGDLDGTWDRGEPAIEGWEIRLYRWSDLGEWELRMTTTTDADGQYGFEGVNPAYNYTVVEVIQEGWMNCTPARVEITDLAAGEGRNVTFGNFICGPPGHTIGFWKENARKNLAGWTNGIQVTKEEYIDYLYKINETYGDDHEWLNFSDLGFPTNHDKLSKAYGTMSGFDHSNMTLKARAHILSLLLTEQMYGEDYSGAWVHIPCGDDPFTGTMREAIQQIFEWYGAGEYEQAKDAADFLNNLDEDR